MKFDKIQISHIGNRKEYLDRVVMGSDGDYNIFAVLDGHQCNEVVDFVSKNLVDVFFNNLENNGVNGIGEIFHKTFDQIQNDVVSKQLVGGTTVSLLYINNSNNATLGFVGDSPCYKMHFGSMIPLNLLHHNICNIRSNGEYDRLLNHLSSQELEDEIESGYLGNVNISRRIGDSIPTEFGVTHIPCCVEVNGGYSHFVLCSDGIHSYFSEYEIRKHLFDNIPVHGLLKDIESKVLLGSEEEKDLDNVTILVVKPRQMKTT
ncbi:MAG: protein phosphatase 2C domain-containing protein [Candidatus Absconditabacteria bacterium]